MFSKKICLMALLMLPFIVNFGFSADANEQVYTKIQPLEEQWDDYLHYLKIGQFDMAKGLAQTILDSNPDPVKILEFVQKNPQGYELLQRMNDSEFVPQDLRELNNEILGIIEKGRFGRRTDPQVIVAEIKRLGSTDRARISAIKRLQDAGEYAIPHMIEAMAGNKDPKELANIIWALPQIGRDAVRPLTTALQTKDLAVKAEIIKALGKIGYPQALSYLKYFAETDSSAELRDLAEASIKQIEPSALQLSAAQLFYKLADNYYYHAESLAPAEDADFANVWFWDTADSRLVAEKVDKNYFYELMAMRACEWSLKADPAFGKSIGLWLAAYFKAESKNIQMPNYFGKDHPEAIVYATTAGPEYLHMALERAVKDKDAYVALGVIEALAVTAGEKSLFYKLGVSQPLMDALSFPDKAVRYSAAIAIAEAGPKSGFMQSKMVAEILAEAFSQKADINTTNQNGSTIWNDKLVDSYALRAGKAMLKLAMTNNTVIDLSLSQDVLIEGTKDNRSQIQVLASQVLAYLGTPDAQRAIAKMSLSVDNSKELRIAAFESLTLSAKLNANLLDDGTIDAIYSLISSKETDPEMQKAAACAYGALNLPSPKVKDLILEQAKN